MESNKFWCEENKWKLGCVSAARLGAGRQKWRLGRSRLERKAVEPPLSLAQGGPTHVMITIVISATVIFIPDFSGSVSGICIILVQIVGQGSALLVR